MRFLSSHELHLDAHTVAVLKEFERLLGAHLEIVGAGGESDADSLYLDFFLLFSVFALALLPLIFELAEVHDLADRGLGIRRDFDEVEPLLLGNFERLHRLHDAEVFSVLADHSHGGRLDILVYAVSLLNGS